MRLSTSHFNDGPIFEQKTILLVENNPDDQMLMYRALRKNNIQSRVVTANHGAEAVDYLSQIVPMGGQEVTPDLIVLDLKMPKMSGFDVLNHIRRLQQITYIPIVVFSSSSEPEDIFHSYQLGANSYICKPIDLEEFNEMVRYLIKYWLIFNLALG